MSLRILTFPYLVILLGVEEMMDPEVPRSTRDLVTTTSPTPSMP
jgi:hypothetical protein